MPTESIADTLERLCARLKGEFREEDHPRAEDGRFGDKPGEGGGEEQAATAAESKKPALKRPEKKLPAAEAVKWLKENAHEPGWQAPIIGNLGGGKNPVMEMDKLRPISNDGKPMPPRPSFAVVMAPSKERDLSGKPLYGGQVFLYKHDGFKYVLVKNKKTKSGAWEPDEAKTRAEVLYAVGVDSGKYAEPEAGSHLDAMYQRRKDAVAEAEEENPGKEILPTGEPVPEGHSMCSRCGGAGLLSQYSHVEGGVCFDCDGLGYKKDKEKKFTSSIPLRSLLTRLQARLKGEFREEDHPRGQPENAGEFAPREGGGGKEEPESEVEQKLEEFKPAAKLPEAEEYAQQFVSGPVSLKGLDVKLANRLNELLADRFGSVPCLSGVKLDEIVTISARKAVMGIFYNDRAGTDTVLVIPKHMKDPEAFGTFWDAAKKYGDAKGQTYAVAALFDREKAFDIALDHELGHAIDNKVLTKGQKAEWLDIYNKVGKEEWGKLSLTATMPDSDNKNAFGDEAFAESVAMVLNGKGGMLPEAVERFVNGVLSEGGKK